MLHGFAGYFETVLYQDITLSECLGQWMGVEEYATWAAYVFNTCCIWSHKELSNQ